MYYLLFIVLYPLSLFPLPALYLLSDVLYVTAYYLTGYRKKVVMDNLRHAFPQKSEQELIQISKDFYRSFCDQWIETIKLMSISKKQLNRRLQGNWEVFHKLDEEGKNTYAMLGHTFNWEWANVACQYNAQQQFAVVYMPLSSKPFDRLMQYIRTRSGAWMISMKAKKTAFQRLNDVRYIMGLAADQNPSQLPQAAWISFLNREAPFYKGPEHMARRAKAAVVFAGIKKIKRGYYRLNLERIVDDASQTQSGEIINRYVSFMEKQINEQPANWMWTHRRWKHRQSS